MKTVITRSKERFLSAMQFDALETTVCIKLIGTNFKFIRHKVTSLQGAKKLLNCIAKLKRTPKSMWGNKL